MCIPAAALPFKVISGTVIGQSNRSFVKTLIQTGAFHLRTGGISHRVNLLGFNQVNRFRQIKGPVGIINAKGNLLIERNLIVCVIVYTIPVNIKCNAVLRAAAVGTDEAIGKIAPHKVRGRKLTNRQDCQYQNPKPLSRNPHLFTFYTNIDKNCAYFVVYESWKMTIRLFLWHVLQTGLSAFSGSHPLQAP